VIATAILDRILYHSTTINIQGNSYRLRENVKAGAHLGARNPTSRGRGGEFSMSLDSQGARKKWLFGIGMVKMDTNGERGPHLRKASKL